MIYVLSSTAVRSEETIQAKCNITSLGYPQISWMWFCSNQAPVSGTAIRFESYISLKITSNDKTIGCRCRATSSITYYEYDEFSDFVYFTVLCKCWKYYFISFWIFNDALNATFNYLILIVIPLSEKNTIYFETVCISIKCRKRYINVFEFSDYWLFLYSGSE